MRIRGRNQAPVCNGTHYIQLADALPKSAPPISAQSRRAIASHIRKIGIAIHRMPVNTGADVLTVERLKADDAALRADLARGGMYDWLTADFWASFDAELDRLSATSPEAEKRSK